jgi:hypothetical protein
MEAAQAVRIRIHGLTYRECRPSAAILQTACIFEIQPSFSHSAGKPAGFLRQLQEIILQPFRLIILFSQVSR